MNRTVTWLWGHLPIAGRLRSALVWAYSPKFTVGVVGVVRDEEGRVLLQRHTYRGRDPWGLPGGGLQSDESLEDCVRRETKEESGIEVEIDRLLLAEARYNRRLMDVVFMCRPKSGQGIEGFQPNAEVSEIGFFSPDKLPEGTPASIRRIIRLAIRRGVGDGQMKPET